MLNDVLSYYLHSLYTMLLFPLLFLPRKYSVTNGIEIEAASGVEGQNKGYNWTVAEEAVVGQWNSESRRMRLVSNVRRRRPKREIRGCD
ncbi:hypothetical protein L1887_35317 [Cichorium endivia]|nr:hypothetical protein L1887_35317 [Cichorium endivia]